jgi:hypothetical protein
MIKSLSFRLAETTFLVVVIGTVLCPISCKDLGEVLLPSTGQMITVALRNTDTYQYPAVGGDEDGALITKQAQHYRVSQVRRDASTNFICVYIYQPEAGYTGNDHAELEIHTNKVGTSEYAQVSKLAFSFTITN